MRAWYKPGHEPSREQIAESPEAVLRRLPLDDLQLLRRLWTSERKDLYAAGNWLPADMELVQLKLASLNAEIERREHDKDHELARLRAELSKVRSEWVEASADMGSTVAELRHQLARLRAERDDALERLSQFIPFPTVNLTPEQATELGQLMNEGDDTP